MSRAPRPLDHLTRAEGAAWGGFLQAHARITQRLDAELRERHDLPLTWFDALWQLWNSPGEQLRMSDLADRVLLTQSGLTRLVSRLEDAGLVRRVPDPEDGRATLAGLTSAGLKRVTEAQLTHVDGIRRHFLSRLSSGQQEVMADAWRRLLKPDAEGKTSREEAGP